MTFKLFTSQTCAYCPKVKQYLDKKNAEYTVHDITDDYEARVELQKKYGAMTVPVLVREDGEFMIGLNIAKMAKLV